MESMKSEFTMQRWQTDAIKDNLPMTLGTRKATAESEAHTVDGDADL